MKAKKASLAFSLDEWDGHIAVGRAEYQGWCPFCVSGKGKSEADRRMEASRDHGYPELHPDYATMGREAEDRASPILVGEFPKERCLMTHPVPCKGTHPRWMVGKLVKDVIMSGVQTLLVKSCQEVSILGLRNFLLRDVCGVDGLAVMLEESPVGAPML